MWGEAPATFEFSTASVERTIHEWMEVLRRDISHPSIVCWVPLNESWGVQHIAHDSRMQAFARALVNVTKALDPSRPLVSNDGWEQVDTDIVTIHDYSTDPNSLVSHYADSAATRSLLTAIGPAGRQLVLLGDISEAPIMVTEFGGIAYDSSDQAGAWGYSEADDATEFRSKLQAAFRAIQQSPALAGFCYTQLTDTLQETNGLLRADRSPKIQFDELRRIVTGAVE